MQELIFTVRCDRIAKRQAYELRFPVNDQLIQRIRELPDDHRKWDSLNKIWILTTPALLSLIKKSNTPKKWSWKFWIRDNWRRYLTTFLCTYILFRFYNELSGHPFGYVDAVGLGLIGDGIAATLKERIKAIGGDRKELTLQIKKEQGEIG